MKQALALLRFKIVTGDNLGKNIVVLGGVIVKHLPSNRAAACEVTFDGVAWILTGYEEF